MKWEEFLEIYNSIGKTSLFDLKKDLIKSAVRYARLRVDWQMADIKGRKTLDETRGIAHNAFIDACNILARNMEKISEDNSWRAILGNNRTEIGNFACFIHFILGLSVA